LLAAAWLAARLGVRPERRPIPEVCYEAPLVTALFARQVRLGRSVDRRLVRRYRPLAAFCQVLAPAPLAGTCPLVKLSPRGACLALRRGVEVGGVIRLRLSNREQLISHEVALRVTHARQDAEGKWLAGGPFQVTLPCRVVEALLR
jgi:hypothetical protein